MGTQITTDGVTSDARYGGLANRDVNSIYYNPGTGRTIPNVDGPAAASASTITANAVRIAPWVSPLTFESDMAYINVTTGAAGSCRVVIYSSDTEGRPDKLLFESAVIDTTAIAIKSVACPFKFVRGQQYWVGLHGSAAAITSAHILANSPSLDATAANPFVMTKSVIRNRTFALGAEATWNWVSSEASTAIPHWVSFRLV